MSDELSLSEMRELARTRLTAVSRKQARLRRNTGVQLRGTKYDVRPADPTVINRLNRRQLQSLINKANEFVSRKTQFVGGLYGEPIRGSKWNSGYRPVERQVSKLANDRLNRFGGLKVPASPGAKALTIREMEAMRTQNNIPRAGRSSTRPLAPINRKDARGIPNEQALDKIIRGLNKKLNPNYYNASLKVQREAARKMFDTIGDKELEAKFNRLSDDQFDVWWNYANQADNVSHRYFIAQAKLEGKESRDRDVRENNLQTELNAKLDWATNLKIDPEQAAARSSRSRLRNNNRRK